MKSGLRGGKPRDTATFKKGGTSRGAGAAKKGFDYAIYKKGGKVKKYEEGGGVETRSYASFGDWMKDLKREFGGKSEKAEAPRATSNRIQREDLPAPSPGAFDPVRQDAMDREEASRRRAAAPVEEREIRRPDPASESLPTAPRPARPSQSAAQRRMAARRRQDQETMARDIAESGMGNDPRARERIARDTQALGVGDDPILAAAAAARRRQIASGLYAKGGKVKMAGGGSCRGMGAAQRGGKYTIK